MQDRLRRPGRDESGFTLVELLIVVVIIGVLMAIAVPAYAGFKSRAADATAKSRLREAATAAVAYSLDNIGTASDPDRNAATRGFQGMTTARLRLYDRGIANGTGSLTVLASKTTATAYCIRITVDTRRWSLLGPNVSGGSYKANLNCN